MFDGVIITGFLPFQTVQENPTALIIDELQKEPHPKILSLKKLDVTCKEVDQHITELFEKRKLQEGQKILNLHLGVAPIQNYHLERCGYNKKDFRIPDNIGYQPRNEQICTASQLDTELQTKLNIDEICWKLGKEGHDVAISLDPGRYLCNYIFYSSLTKLCNENCTSLFIHFPPKQWKSHEQNMNFIRDFLKIVLD